MGLGPFLKGFGKFGYYSLIFPIGGKTLFLQNGLKEGGVV